MIYNHSEYFRRTSHSSDLLRGFEAGNWMIGSRLHAAFLLLGAITVMKHHHSADNKTRQNTLTKSDAYRYGFNLCIFKFSDTRFPEPRRCFPKLADDISTWTTLGRGRGRGRWCLRFLQKVTERFLKLGGCSGVRTLAVGFCNAHLAWSIPEVFLQEYLFAY